eukprot:scaffold1021_cov108-Isochrysis_galbana.AAC.6
MGGGPCAAARSLGFLRALDRRGGAGAGLDRGGPGHCGSARALCIVHLARAAAVAGQAQKKKSSTTNNP